MRKLIILPGSCDSLGGTLVTLSLLIKGCELNGTAPQLSVLVWAKSPVEAYLQQAGQTSYLVSIEAKDREQFFQRALAWVKQQPKDYPLLLDNCVSKNLLSTLLKQALPLRWSGRPIYHFFHDLTISQNRVGQIVRQLAFTLLAPKGLCNSKFTAGYIYQFTTDIRGILYQPVDPDRFNSIPVEEPPAALKPILEKGDRLLLTPSRINKPDIINDKNLRGLIPVVAHLRQQGHQFHLVIMGDDRSTGKARSQALLDAAQEAGIAEHFTVLPPAYDVETYYKFADAVVTLAPREPFGRIVVEAIACGVPVVGSNTGGIAEILNHFAPQWTVDPMDPIAAAETIVRVVHDPQTTATLSQGQTWVQDQCNMVEYAHRIMELTGMPSTKPGIQEAQAGR